VKTSIAGSYFNPFRLASYLLILYCAGHTWGALLSVPRFGAESLAVMSAMKSVHFRCQTSDCTWFGFYFGFGLFLSVFLLFSAAVTWFIGGLGRDGQDRLFPITWMLFLTFVAGTVIAWEYFFALPALFSTAIAALIGFQCLAARRARAEP
jgi:hypothetical protein